MNQQRVTAAWWLGVVIAVGAIVLAVLSEVSAPDCEGALLIQADIEQSTAALRAKYIAENGSSDPQAAARNSPHDARDTGELGKVVLACRANGNALSLLDKIAIGMGVAAIGCWTIALLSGRRLRRESPARFVVREAVRMPRRRRH
jgi:hypothetical protein